MICLSHCQRRRSFRIVQDRSGSFRIAPCWQPSQILIPDMFPEVGTGIGSITCDLNLKGWRQRIPQDPLRCFRIVRKWGGGRPAAGVHVSRMIIDRILAASQGILGGNPAGLGRIPQVSSWTWPAGSARISKRILKPRGELLRMDEDQSGSLWIVSEAGLAVGIKAAWQFHLRSGGIRQEPSRIRRESVENPSRIRRESPRILAPGSNSIEI